MDGFCFILFNETNNDGTYDGHERVSFVICVFSIHQNLLLHPPEICRAIFIANESIDNRLLQIQNSIPKRRRSTMQIFCVV